MSNRSTNPDPVSTVGRSSGPIPAPAVPGEQGLFGSWVRFWFAPAEPVALHGLRLVAGLVFLGWLLTCVGHQQAMFGLNGWFDRQAYREASRLTDAPPYAWSVLYLAGNNALLINLIYGLSLLILALFTLGLFPRLMAVLTWVVVVSFGANPVFARYGADELLGIFAFYLMIGYVLWGQWSRRPQSLVARLLGPNDSWLGGNWLTGRTTEQRGGRVQPERSHGANLALRLLQIHFVLIVVTSGLHKLQSGDWWSGAALWYALNRPLEVTAESIRAQADSFRTDLIFLSLGAYLILAWQIALPLFAWRTGWWRLVLIGGAAIGWVASVFLWKNPVFGAVYFVGALSFVTAAEWRALADRLRALRPRSAGNRQKAATSGPRVAETSSR